MENDTVTRDNVRKARVKAFKNIGAIAVVFKGEHVANINIKWGNACTAYVHFLGTECQQFTAKGSGYDKESFAIIQAIERISESEPWKYENPALRSRASFKLFTSDHIVESDDWFVRLRDKGFTMLNVI